MLQLKNGQYVAWVPCISGTLVFECTNCGLGTEKKVSANLVDISPKNKQDYRYIVVSSLVDWRDYGDDDGRWRVVLLGKVSPSLGEDCVDGRIFILPEDKTKKLWHWVDEGLSKISNMASSECSLGQASSEYDILLDRLQKVNDTEQYEIPFLLSSTGIVSLDYKDEDKTHEYTVVRQSFYYLKYSFHRHQHHKHSDDSITVPYLFNGDNKDLANNLLFDLRKAMVNTRRYANEVHHSDLLPSQGIPYYALSLLESLKREGVVLDEYEYEKNYLNNFCKSLEIISDRKINESNDKLLFNSHLSSWVLLFLAVFGPLSIIYKDKIMENIFPTNSSLCDGSLDQCQNLSASNSGEGGGFLGFASVIYSHPTIAIVLLCLLIGYLAANWFSYRKPLTSYAKETIFKDSNYEYNLKVQTFSAILVFVISVGLLFYIKI